MESLTLIVACGTELLLYSFNQPRIAESTNRQHGQPLAALDSSFMRCVATRSFCKLGMMWRYIVFSGNREATMKAWYFMRDIA